MRRLFLPALCLCLTSCAQSQPQPQNPAPTLPLRALIVSGGPSPTYNQYAIESNARYVEKLTMSARFQRVLFADGRKTSRTISTLEDHPESRERTVLNWIFGFEDEVQREVLRSPTLKRLDGPSTKKSVTQSVQNLSLQLKKGERGLLYFTGHGSPGTKPRLALFGAKTQEDFDNTLYSLWNDDELSTRELAGAVHNWPQNVPLVLVMVQCHAGGFANVMFEGAKPGNPLWNRDFCGFFAATARKQASGCTTEVDERNYQDFTTHFFAALSGISRDGRRIDGADYDRSGTVSLLEAYAYSNVQDGSIDVPLCTSDAYLRQVFPSNPGDTWMKTPYSQLLSSAAPWQKAMLDGLSAALHLTGENRVENAAKTQGKTSSSENAADSEMPSSLDAPDVTKRYNALEIVLKTRFPGLKAKADSPQLKNAKSAALRYLKTRPRDVAVLSQAAQKWSSSDENSEAHDAMILRFVRVARTVVLQKRLEIKGTKEQKAAFSRLRKAESRNPLKS